MFFVKVASVHDRVKSGLGLGIVGRHTYSCRDTIINTFSTNFVFFFCFFAFMVMQCLCYPRKIFNIQ